LFPFGLYLPSGPFFHSDDEGFVFRRCAFKESSSNHMIFAHFCMRQPEVRGIIRYPGAFIHPTNPEPDGLLRLRQDRGPAIRSLLTLYRLTPEAPR